MQEISATTTKFKDKTQDIVEFIQGRLTWLETTKEIPKKTPFKGLERLQLKYELIGFINKAIEKFIEAVKKTIEKCSEFYKKVLTTHNRCQTASKRRLDVLPAHEEHLVQLQARMQEDELNIQLVKSLNEKVIKI